MTDPDWTPMGGWDLVATYLWPAILATMTLASIAWAAWCKGDF